MVLFKSANIQAKCLEECSIIFKAICIVFGGVVVGASKLNKQKKMNRWYYNSLKLTDISAYESIKKKIPCFSMLYLTCF